MSGCSPRHTTSSSTGRWDMAALTGPFVDLFKYNRRCEFDPTRAAVYADEIPIYFLHGALHLVVGGSGATWKLTRTTFETLLDQFGEPIAGDPHARPLLGYRGVCARQASGDRGERLPEPCNRTASSSSARRDTRAGSKWRR